MHSRKIPIDIKTTVLLNIENLIVVTVNYTNHLPSQQVDSATGSDKNTWKQKRIKRESSQRNHNGRTMPKYKIREEKIIERNRFN